MKPTPLVSVIVPCFNAASTLKFALSSVIAQTLTDWECIVVDDGSTDSPVTVVRGADDDRIKFIPLSRNMGRGYARQTGLETAKGEYVSFVDADDWIYPDKLTDQISALRRFPQVDLISGGMAIVDRDQAMVGIRADGPAHALVVRDPVPIPTMPSIAFGPCMIRTSVARLHGFDVQMRATEDMDLLCRIMMRTPYLQLPGAAYAYAEHTSNTIQKILAGLMYTRRMFAKYRRDYPRQYARIVLSTVAKDIVYRVGFAAGLGRRLIERRSAAPTPSDLQAFKQAKAVVFETASSIFDVDRTTWPPETNIQTVSK